MAKFPGCPALTRITELALIIKETHGMARIELEKVGLTFRLRLHGRSTLKELLVRRLLRWSAPSSRKVEALRDITLRLKDGDRLGLIGQNGAGKTSLLRLLAGIYPPTHGRRIVEGMISSLFEISLGFEPDATGWENIAYRGYLQGDTPAGIRAKRLDIADFSELGKFLDMPVRSYSAGMMVRLAFSIATAMEPEVLLIDEVLSAGDLSFQQKARRRLNEMLARARIIVMASHDLRSLPEMCSQAVWLECGEIRLSGSPGEVIRAYHAAMLQQPPFPSGGAAGFQSPAA